MNNPKFLMLVILILYLILPPSFSYGLDARQHDEYVKKFNKIMPKMKALIQPILTPREKIIIENIKINILASNRLIANAELQGDTRHITFSTGILFLLDQSFQTFVHQEFLKAGPCFLEYGRYLRSKMNAGIQSTERILSADDTAKSECICLKFSGDAILNNASSRRMIIGGVEQITFFAYLHEIAHHVKGHFSSTNGSIPEQEIEADIWALDKAFAARYELTSAVPAILLFMDLEHGTFANSHDIKTHQPADDRVKLLLDYFIKRYESRNIPKRFPDHVYAWIISEIKGYYDYISELRAKVATQYSVQECQTISKIKNYDPFVEKFMHNIKR